MEFLHFAPGGVSNALAVGAGRDKQDVQIAATAIGLNDHTADGLAVLQNAIGFAAVDGLLDGPAGTELAIFFKMIVPASEFLQRTIVECSLSSLVKGHN